MNFFKKNKEIKVMAFTSGTIIPLKDVKDEMFSNELMGPGIAIASIDGKIYSPVDGVVTMLFPTKHALGIKTKDGKEILLHIGIDTVTLNGEGFTAFVKEGETVTIGQLLLEVDLAFIREKQLPTEAILCISEPKDARITFTLKKTVNAKEDVLVTIKE